MSWERHEQLLNPLPIAPRQSDTRANKCSGKEPGPQAGTVSRSAGLCHTAWQQREAAGTCARHVWRRERPPELGKVQEMWGRQHTTPVIYLVTQTMAATYAQCRVASSPAALGPAWTQWQEEPFPWRKRRSDLREVTWQGRRGESGKRSTEEGTS